VSKFQQIAMSRQAQQIAARRDFWLYIDEFANFITPTMAEILSGARKYRIGLTLAHHELHQLQKSPEVASAVMSHPYTRIVFRVGDDDARKLADGFAYFEAPDLRNLETGRAIARVERSDYDFNLAVPLPVEPDKARAKARRQEVITASREKYARPRTEIETALRAALGSPSAEAEPSKAVQRPTPKEPEAKPISQPADILKSSIEEKQSTTDTDAEDTDHTAIKKQIAAEAEALDYTATTEEALPSGGRIDVVLRRGSRAIACEVSVTNTVGYETENVLKCQRAGFKDIAVIARSRRKLSHIQELLSERSAGDLACIGFYAPEEFISKLFTSAQEDPAGAAVEKGKPRKRKIALGSALLTQNERAMREVDMLESLRQAMKRRGAAESRPRSD
jgi:hypothetical protein